MRENPVQIGQLTDNPVVSHAGQSDPGLPSMCRIADKDDVALGRQDGAGPLGEATLEADVDDILDKIKNI